MNGQCRSLFTKNGTKYIDCGNNLLSKNKKEMGRFDKILVRKERIEEKSFDTQIYLQQTYGQRTSILFVFGDSLTKKNNHLRYILFVVLQL